MIKKETLKKGKIFMMKELNLFGKTGNFNGTDVLNIILEQKATAKFITAKIYKFFVNENVDQNIVNSLSKVSTSQVMT
jgi:uncharacterized protein (DUF1800 family)